MAQYDFLERPGDKESDTTRTPLDFAVQLCVEVLKVDKGWASEVLGKQVEAAGGLPKLGIHGEQDVTIGVTVGTCDNQGKELTPHRVISGHDSLLKGRESRWHETRVDEGIYGDSSSEWWNWRLPLDKQKASGIQIVDDPIVILGLSGLQQGLGKSWHGKGKDLVKRSLAESADTVAVVGASPLDIVMGDASAVLRGKHDERPAAQSRIVQFPQHSRTRGRGPTVSIPGGFELTLGPSAGWGYDRDRCAGYRTVSGPRKQRKPPEAA